jgi:hypothetical protein
MLSSQFDRKYYPSGAERGEEETGRGKRDFGNIEVEYFFLVVRGTFSYEKVRRARGVSYGTYSLRRFIYFSSLGTFVATLSQLYAGIGSILTVLQWSGSIGSACFWSFRIRICNCLCGIRICRMDMFLASLIRTRSYFCGSVPVPSYHQAKNICKNLYFYTF